MDHEPSAARSRIVSRHLDPQGRAVVPGKAESSNPVKTLRRFRYLFLGAGVGCAFDALVISASGAKHELWFAGAAVLFCVLFVLGLVF
jgi:hypothetical protein